MWHTVRVDVPKVVYVDIEGTFVVGGTRSKVRGILKYRSQQKNCFGVLCNFIVTPRFIIALEPKEQKRRSRVGRTDGRVFVVVVFFLFLATRPTPVVSVDVVARSSVAARLLRVL